MLKELVFGDCPDCFCTSFVKSIPSNAIAKYQIILQVTLSEIKKGVTHAFCDLKCLKLNCPQEGPIKCQELHNATCRQETSILTVQNIISIYTK